MSKGITLRPLKELDDEIQYLNAYHKKLLEQREVRLKISKLTTIESAGHLGTITEIAAKICDCDKELIYSRTRKQHVVDSRFLIFYIARKHTGLSLETIAKHFGMKDHNSVTHGEKRARELAKQSKHYAAQIVNVEMAFLERIEKAAT